MFICCIWCVQDNEQHGDVENPKIDNLRLKGEKLRNQGIKKTYFQRKTKGTLTLTLFVVYKIL